MVGAAGKSDEAAPAEVGVLDVVYAHQLHYFPDLVAELGGDPHNYLRHLGADDPGALEPGHATYRQISDLLEMAAADLNCPDFGMRLALRQGATGTLGPAGEAMRKAATFGEALQFVINHAYAHSLGAGIWSKRYPSQGLLQMGHAFLVDGPLIRAQVIEQIFLIGQLMALELTGGRVRVRRVSFRHQPLSSMQTYRRYFGSSVLFGQPADSITYYDQDLVCPIVESDPQAYRQALVDIEGRVPEGCPPLRSRVRVTVNHFLNTEFCTRADVAETLKMHPRTMDRRLNDEGTSFLRIKDEVRRDLLLYYVQHSNFDFLQISEWLGFSEQSVMTRSCRKWFSLTPRELRSDVVRKRGTRLADAANPGEPLLQMAPVVH